MNGRVYDVDTARFLSADPNIFHPFDTQNFNRYSYVMNNPLMYTDPSGFDVFSQDDYENGYHLDDPHEAGKSHVNNDSSTNNYSQSEKDKITAELRKKKAIETALKEYMKKVAELIKAIDKIPKKFKEYIPKTIKVFDKMVKNPFETFEKIKNIKDSKDSVKETLSITAESLGPLGGLVGREIVEDVFYGGMTDPMKDPDEMPLSP